MRILFVVGTLGKGGAERQLFYLCKLLISNGNEIEVLSFTSGEFYESKIKSIGVTVQNCKSSKNKLSKLFQIYKQTSNYKPDVIFGFHFYTGFYVGLVGRICSVLSIGSIRSNGIVEKESNGLFSWLHYAFPKLIIANSKNAIENVQHVFYKKSIEYLPNIIDFDYFSFQKKQKSNKISLLFIGSLKEIKQPNLFIDLVVQLIYNNCNLEAKIIGEGYLFNSLKLQAKNLPIDFLGNIDDIRPYLSEADFLISTSKFEGTPNVMLEAFASGTPVIALYHKGLNEWINNKLLFETKNINEISELILKKNNFNEIYNRNFIMNNHSDKIVYESFLKILSDKL